MIIAPTPGPARGVQHPADVVGRVDQARVDLWWYVSSLIVLMPVSTASAASESVA